MAREEMLKAARAKAAAQAAAVSGLPAERYEQLYAHTALGLDEWQYWWRILSNTYRIRRLVFAGEQVYGQVMPVFSVSLWGHLKVY